MLLKKKAYKIDSFHLSQAIKTLTLLKYKDVVSLGGLIIWMITVLTG